AAGYTEFRCAAASPGYNGDYYDEGGGVHHRRVLRGCEWLQHRQVVHRSGYRSDHRVRMVRELQQPGLAAGHRAAGGHRQERIALPAFPEGPERPRHEWLPGLLPGPRNVRRLDLDRQRLLTPETRVPRLQDETLDQSLTSALSGGEILCSATTTCNCSSASK